MLSQSSQIKTGNNVQQEVQFFLKMKAQPNLTCYIITFLGDQSQLLDMNIHSEDDEHMIFSATVSVLEQAIYQYKYSKKIDGVNQTEQNFRLFQFNDSSKNLVDEWNKYWCEYSIQEIIFGIFEVFNISILKENNDLINLTKSKDQDQNYECFELIENNNQPVYRTFYFQGIQNQQLQFESKRIDITQQNIIMNRRQVNFSIHFIGDDIQTISEVIDQQIKQRLEQEIQRNIQIENEFNILKERNENLQNEITQLQNESNVKDIQLKRSLEQQCKKKLALNNQYITSEQSILQFKQQLEYNKSQFLVQLEKDNYQIEKQNEGKLYELNQQIAFEKSLKEEQMINIQNQKNEEILKSKYLLEQSIQQLKQQQENQLQNKIQSLNLQPVIIENIEDVPESVKISLQQLKNTIEDLEQQNSESTQMSQRQVQKSKTQHKQIKQKQASLDSTLEQIKRIEKEINQIQEESDYFANKQEPRQIQLKKIKDQLQTIKEQILTCQEEINVTLNQLRLADEKQQNLNKEMEEQKQNLEKFQTKIQQQKEEAENQFQEVLMKNKEKQQQMISQIKFLHQKQIDQQKEFFNNFQRDLQQKIVRKFIEAEQQYFQKARVFQNEINVLINHKVDAIKRLRIEIQNLEIQMKADVLQLFDRVIENQSSDLIEQLLNLIEKREEEVIKQLKEALSQLKKLVLSSIYESNELNYQQVYLEYFPHLIESECNMFFEQLLQQQQEMI